MKFVTNVLFTKRRKDFEFYRWCGIDDTKVERVRKGQGSVAATRVEGKQRVASLCLWLKRKRRERLRESGKELRKLGVLDGGG